MRLRIVLLLVLAMVGLSAQAPAVSYTVTIWPMVNGITSATPASTVIYPVASVPCGQPKLPQAPLPLVNPTEGRFDDPADPTLDCVINLTAQVTALPTGTGYKAGWRSDGSSGSSAYGALTDPFERRLGPPLTPPIPQHPRLR